MSTRGKPRVESILAKEVARFQLVDVLFDSKGYRTLEYRVRTRKNHPPGRLVEAVRAQAQGHVLAVEYAERRRR